MADPDKEGAVKESLMTGPTEYDQRTEQMRKRDEQLKHQLRRARIFVRILDVGFGVSAIALMAFSLRKYYETLNLSANGENLWNPPDQTVLWPTYFTLVSSVLTSVFAACVLAAYLYSTTTAEKIDDWRSRILWLALFLKIALEITTSSGMYATGAHGPSDGPQSLWYQTCTATRDTVELFKPWINIDQFCGMQKWGSIAALLSIILDALSVVTFIYWFQHWRHQKMMKRHLSEGPERSDRAESK